MRYSEVKNHSIFKAGTVESSRGRFQQWIALVLFHRTKGTSFADCTRNAISQCLKGEAELREFSVYDLMKDGLGIVRSNCDDLASNSKHMDGFREWFKEVFQLTQNTEPFLCRLQMDVWYVCQPNFQEARTMSSLGVCIQIVSVPFFLQIIILLRILSFEFVWFMALISAS